MFQRLRYSWDLIKASLSVLRADKELIVFPIVSGLATLLVTLTFAAPLWLSNAFGALLGGGATVLGVVVLFLFYLVQYLVIFFANAALVGAAMIRLQGGDPTLGDGFRVAFRHLGPILGYAAIAATVGVVLRMVSERAGSLGRVIISLVGFAWNVATYLVVPVLVVEGVGPLDAIKRSVTLLKKTWGEQIAGGIGVNLIFGLAALLVLLIGVPLIVLAAMSELWPLVIVILGLMLLAWLLLALVGSTLNGIYTAAVYRYAVTGETGGLFREELVEQAFRRR